MSYYAQLFCIFSPVLSFGSGGGGSGGGGGDGPICKLVLARIQFRLNSKLDLSVAIKH